MFESMRSRFARNTLAAGLLTATAVLSFGAPAHAEQLDSETHDFWIEQYDDHTVITVDWFAVPKAADDAENNVPACVQAST